MELKCVWTAYSIASIEPKFALVGGQNIPVTDLLMEVVEFETGPFLAEETEPKMRKGVASRFLTDLPIGWSNSLVNKRRIYDFCVKILSFFKQIATLLQNCLSEKCRIKNAK